MYHTKHVGTLCRRVTRSGRIGSTRGAIVKCQIGKHLFGHFLFDVYPGHGMLCSVLSNIQRIVDGTRKIEKLQTGVSGRVRAGIFEYCGGDCMVGSSVGYEASVYVDVGRKIG